MFKGGGLTHTTLFSESDRELCKSDKDGAVMPIKYVDAKK